MMCGSEARKRRKFIFALTVLLAVTGISVLYAVAQPFIFAPVFARELTPKIVSINDVPTDSIVFEKYGRDPIYRERDVTIVVEVTRNHHRPVKGAAVTIYGCGDSATGKTDERGYATLRLHVKPTWIHGTPAGHLSMGVVKEGYDYFVDPHAVKIIYL